MTSFHLIIAVDRPAGHAGPDDGAVGVRRVLLRHRRLALDRLRQAGAVDGRRPVRVLRRAADAGAADAQRWRSPGSPSPSSCWSWCWSRESARWPTVLAAGSSSPGFSMQPSELAKIAFADLGCAPAGRPPHGAGVAARDAGSAGARRGHRAGARSSPSPTSGRRCRWASSCSACSGTPGCRCGCSVSSLVAVVVSAAVLAMAEGYRSDRVQSWLNPGADAQGSGYQARQAQVRAGQRRRVRRRAGPGHRQVELPAQRPQRLHLRDHRRGARLRRRWRGCCACSGCSPTPACGSPVARPIRSCGC